MTTRSEDPADDGYWRRPEGDGQPGSAPPDPPRNGSPEPEEGGAATGSPAHRYTGPPPGTPPPPGWRPPVVVNPAPPRQLPTQDTAAVENEERGARTLTYGVAMLGAAVLVIVICLLCSRIVF